MAKQTLLSLADLRSQKTEQLLKQVRQIETDLANYRLALALKKEKNTHLAKSLRVNKARILTVLTEQKLLKQIKNHD